MYRLLVVEDEDFIREAIVNCLDWQHIGFEVKSAPDGEIALEIARDFKPHALLTDICMPFVDGLELIERLMKDIPDLATVILSGHEEFDYAQRALKFGVMDYLMKPILPKTLEECMTKLALALQNQSSVKMNLRRMQSQLTEALPLLREKYLSNMVEHSIKSEDISKQLQFLELNVRGTCYTVCVFDHIEQEDVTDEQLMRFAILNILQEEFSTDAQCFCDYMGRHIAIYCGRSQCAEEREYITTVIESAQESIFEALEAEITVSIGKSVSLLSDLPDSYNSALNALENQVFFGRGRIYDCTDYEPRSETNFFLPTQDTSALISSLKFDAREDFIKKSDLYFSNLHDINCDGMTNLQILFIDLANSLHKMLVESEFSDCTDPAIYKILLNIRTLDAGIECMKEYLLKTKAKLDGIRKSKTATLIGKACQYIEQNFQSATISLGSTAAHIYVTPSYLSVLFKREYNTTFVDYVTKLRMEQAKALLMNSDMKTYEVATQVGYNDPQYFSSCFKKYTTLTPSDFRNKKK